MTRFMLRRGLLPGVLALTLNHPENATHRLRAFVRWFVHNIRRRISPGRTIRVSVGDDLFLTGPVAVYIPSGRHDVDAFFALDSILKPDDVFVDVGANIGAYCVQIGRRLGSGGLIVAVEPVDGQVHYLSRNLEQLSPRTIVIRAALADQSRTIGFEPKGPTTGHLSESADSSAVEVTTTTLDAIAGRVGITGRRIFVKIDVEGWEPAVVIGAQAVLPSVCGILLEANGLQERCPIRWSDAVDVLHAHGFSFVWPFVDRRALEVFPHPEAVAPRGDYLALRDDALTALRASLRD